MTQPTSYGPHWLIGWEPENAESPFGGFGAPDSQWRGIDGGFGEA